MVGHFQACQVEPLCLPATSVDHYGGVVLVRFKPDFDDQLVFFSALKQLIRHCYESAKAENKKANVFSTKTHM